MKLLLSTALMLAASTALYAQTTKPDAKLLQRALAYKMNGPDTIRNFAPRIEIVPGTRVQTLPQDGMPCIVPDAEGIAAMPNALLIKKPVQPIAGQIPNAWKKGKEEENIMVK